MKLPYLHVFKTLLWKGISKLPPKQKKSFHNIWIWIHAEISVNFTIQRSPYLAAKRHSRRWSYHSRYRSEDWHFCHVPGCLPHWSIVEEWDFKMCQALLESSCCRKVPDYSASTLRADCDQTGTLNYASKAKCRWIALQCVSTLINTHDAFPFWSVLIFYKCIVTSPSGSEQRPSASPNGAIVEVVERLTGQKWHVGQVKCEWREWREWRECEMWIVCEVFTFWGTKALLQETSSESGPEVTAGVGTGRWDTLSAPMQRWLLANVETWKHGRGAWSLGAFNHKFNQQEIIQDPNRNMYSKVPATCVTGLPQEQTCSVAARPVPRNWSDCSFIHVETSNLYWASVCKKLSCHKEKHLSTDQI